MNLIKKFFRGLRRDWELMWRDSRAFERLARLKAYRLDGTQFEIVSIHPTTGGCFLKVKGSIEPSDSFEMIWVGRPIDVQPGGMVTVRYVSEPQRELVRFYGNFDYRSRPTTYLAV